MLIVVYFSAVILGVMKITHCDVSHTNTHTHKYCYTKVHTRRWSQHPTVNSQIRNRPNNVSSLELFKPREKKVKG